MAMVICRRADRMREVCDMGASGGEEGAMMLRMEINRMALKHDCKATKLQFREYILFVHLRKHIVRRFFPIMSCACAKHFIQRNCPRHNHNYIL